MIELALRTRTFARTPTPPRRRSRIGGPGLIERNMGAVAAARSECSALAATTHWSRVARSAIDARRACSIGYDLPLSFSGLDVLVGGGVELALDDLSELDELDDAPDGGVGLEELGLD
jgi:hypothetical protein